MTALRPYQERAVRLVRERWAESKRRVCLVAPTGSGKTVMIAALVAAEARAVVVVHRRELVEQTLAKLQALDLHAAALCPGYAADPAAPVQVGTIQTLLARDVHPPADLVVLDEAHHFATASETWSTFAAAYQTARHLGCTATPERRDGSPLGDIFDALVVAATYSELLDAGHLAQCHVHKPADDHAESGWAMDPVLAYQEHAAGTRALVFMDRVDRCSDYALRFCTAGVPARAITERTSPSDRAEWLADFAAGRLSVLTNVMCLTEGLDVPAAQTCILARGGIPAHVSTYLQMVGRVLRPHPDKPHALLLDLIDAVGRHGLPTLDRTYSLTGEGISTGKSARSGLVQCPECMCVFSGAAPPVVCPSCGWIKPSPELPKITIYSSGLRRVYAGTATPDDAKADELRRLRSLAASRGWTVGFVYREYAKLFGESPNDASEEERHREYDALRRLQRERGFKPGFARARYKALFGWWPSRQWDTAASPRGWSEHEADLTASDDAETPAHLLYEPDGAP